MPALGRRPWRRGPACQAGHAGSIPLTRSKFSPARMRIRPAPWTVGAAPVPYRRRPLLTADHRIWPVLEARIRHEAAARAAVPDCRRDRAGVRRTPGRRTDISPRWVTPGLVGRRQYPGMARVRLTAGG